MKVPKKPKIKLSENALTCLCGAKFDTYFHRRKHREQATDAVCQQRKKRGFAARPNAAAIHREQMKRRYYHLKKEKYDSAEEVEKRKLREENKE